MGKWVSAAAVRGIVARIPPLRTKRAPVGMTGGVGSAGRAAARWSNSLFLKRGARGDDVLLWRAPRGVGLLGRNVGQVGTELD
jgi:hypothetical protein